jgi:hypothetical protein
VSVGRRSLPYQLILSRRAAAPHRQPRPKVYERGTSSAVRGPARTLGATSARAARAWHQDQLHGSRGLVTALPPCAGCAKTSGVCDSPGVHRTLWGTGSGLMVASLLVALILSTVDPLWAEQHLTLLVALGWAQQAALVLGATLIGAGLVVVRLAPPPVAHAGARPGPSSDWFA